MERMKRPDTPDQYTIMLGTCSAYSPKHAPTVKLFVRPRNDVRWSGPSIEEHVCQDLLEENWDLYNFYMYEYILR
ncbi:unnamed protein product [Lupinus luteus]|uniref:Uncharacterized protein n=1 Tax=Lupinus luteus TaxID=3873 RepID=A0AAV1XB08_LUPLU